MTLADIIVAVGNRLDWVQFSWNWDITDDGAIIPALPLPFNLTLDTEVEVHYQWYWHCNPDIDEGTIQKAIEDHDYDTFDKFHRELLHEDLLFLPCDADILVNGEFVGTVCIAYSPETFALITSQDCECG